MRGFLCISTSTSCQGCPTKSKKAKKLYHALDELVDLLSTGTGLATLEEVEELGLGGESAVGAGQLEGPEEVVGALEVGTDGVDLVDEVGDASDAGALEALLDDGVLGDGDALLVELSEAALVDELLDGVAGGVAVGDVGLDEAEHADGGLVELDEGGVVDLAEAEELEDLLGLGADADDTADADDEGDLGLGGDVEATLGLGLAAVGNGGLLLGLVLGLVLLGVGDEGLLVGLLLGAGGLGLGKGGLGDLGLGGLLLENGLGGLHLCSGFRWY